MTDAPSEQEIQDDRIFSRWLSWAIGGFVIACVVMFFVAGAIKPEVQPGFPVSEGAVPHTDGTFQITIDVKDRTNWIGIDLAAGRVVLDPAKADIMARRYILRAPGGAIDLGADVPLADAAVTADADWVEDKDVDGDPQNPALTSWYDYGYMSHLLNSKEKTFAVRMKGGGIAYLEILSYYCEPHGSGCLTVKYRLGST